MKTARRPILTVLCISLTILAVTLADRPAQACRAMPTRMLRNLDEWLAQADRDLNADGHNAGTVYQCARAHLFAAVHRTESVSLHTYNETLDYIGQVVPGTHVSDEQATDHFRRAYELLARAEMLDGGLQAIPMARGFLLEHCSRNLALVPGDLTPLPAAETRAWQALIAELGSPEAAVRQRAYRRLADQNDAILPVLAAEANHANLGIRLQVRELIQACWREQALGQYRRAYDLYTQEAQTAKEDLAYIAERINSGNACLRLIQLRTARVDETKWVQSFQKTQKRLAKHYSAQTRVDLADMEPEVCG